MAKKKGRKPLVSEELRDSNIIVRCRASYKEWLARFAKKERSNPTYLVDQALAELAKARGFEEPPER